MPTTTTDRWQALDDLDNLIAAELRRTDLDPDEIDGLLRVKDYINRQKRELRGC